MSPLLTVIFLAVMLLVFAQFGKHIAARLSTVWWLVLVFILIASIDPEFFRPIADLLGVQVISNFFLASMIIFLFIQTIEQHVSSTRASRAIRRIVSSYAARAFVPIGLPVPSSTNAPTALLLLPCFNEATSLQDSVSRIVTTLGTQNDAIVTCVVDDGSRDESRQILDASMSGRFTSHDVNVGVSGVLLTGFLIMERLGLDYVIQCDTDGQHPIELVPAMLREAIRQKTDLLIGSRFAQTPLPDATLCDSSENAKSTTKARMAGLWFISQALRMFNRRVCITDPTSGFRVYSRAAANDIVQNLPDEYPEPESIAILMVRNRRIAECRIPMKARTGGRSSIRGIRPFLYMVKVLSALLGLRIRARKMDHQ